MNIPSNQVMSAITFAIIAKISDRLPAPTFLKNYFPDKMRTVFDLSWMVRRYTETLATPMDLNSPPHFNAISTSDQKTVSPLYYQEAVTFNNMTLFDRVWNSPLIDEGVYNEFTDIAAENLAVEIDKIERSLVLACSQALYNGIVTVGTSPVNFGRLAASTLGYNASYDFTQVGVNPFDIIGQWCQWLVNYGKCTDGTFDMIMSETAKAALYNNEVFQKLTFQNLNNNLQNLSRPVKDGIGATTHGEITCGNFKVMIKTLAKGYDVNNNGTVTVGNSYIPSGNLYLLPPNPGFITGNGQCPQVITDFGSRTQMEWNSSPMMTEENPYVIDSYIDIDKNANVIRVKRRAMPIITFRDRVLTAMVCPA